MNKTFSSITFLLILLFGFYSCNNQSSTTEEQAKIENTLQSVSYFRDTVGIDPQVLSENFGLINDAIAKIGYPDAGYKLWINQEEDSDIRFMVEGFWPDQEAYDKIHSDQLYIDAGDANPGLWDGLTSVQYVRFSRVK